MAFLLASRFITQRLLAFDSKVVLCTAHRAYGKATKGKGNECVQAIHIRPGETHDDKNLRLGRPLSPHLTIYKPQATSMLSICHRVFGTVFSGYLVAFALWALLSPYDFCYAAEYLECMDPPPFLVYFCRFALCFPFIYHTCNGVRHLVWDTGKCLVMRQVYITGAIMVATALILTGIAVFVL